MTGLICLTPVLVALATYFIMNKPSLIELYSDKIPMGKSTVKLVFLASVTFLTQLISGFFYNIQRSSKSEKEAVQDIKKSIKNSQAKDKFLKKIHIALIWFHTRLVIITYSVYEFTAFYLLSLGIFGISLSDVNGQELGKSLLIILIKATFITLGVGTLIKLLLDSLLSTKHPGRILSKCFINLESKAGKLVYDLQMQFCNLTFILILPLTLIGIFGKSVEEGATGLFIIITSLVIAAYSFMLAKSKFFQLIFRLID